MVLRRTRLVARVLCGIILALWVAAILYLGPDHPFPKINGGQPTEVPLAQAAFRSFLVVVLLMLAYEHAARVRRWRRNLIRAGGVFATSWLGGLLIVIAFQLLSFAEIAGYDIDRNALFASLIGTLLIIRADQLPKSRPAWFNGIALPIFAARADVWRRVHKASALRLLAIGILAIGLAAFGTGDTDPMRLVMGLMLLELVLATGHALWLGATTSPREE